MYVYTHTYTGLNCSRPLIHWFFSMVITTSFWNVFFIWLQSQHILQVFFLLLDPFLLCLICCAHIPFLNFKHLRFSELTCHYLEWSHLALIFYILCPPSCNKAFVYNALSTLNLPTCSLINSNSSFIHTTDRLKGFHSSLYFFFTALLTFHFISE